MSFFKITGQISWFFCCIQATLIWVSKIVCCKEFLHILWELALFVEFFSCFLTDFFSLKMQFFKNGWSKLLNFFGNTSNMHVWLWIIFFAMHFFTFSEKWPFLLSFSITHIWFFFIKKLDFSKMGGPNCLIFFGHKQHACLTLDNFFCYAFFHI